MAGPGCIGGECPPVVALQALFGFVPNVFRAQPLLPRVIEAEAGIACALLLEERDLSRIQKASMSLAISAAHGDDYWVTGYYQLLRSTGVPGDTLDRIVVNDHQADLSTRDQALLDFARKLAKRGRERWNTCRRSSKNAVKARTGLLAAERNLEYWPKDQGFMARVKRPVGGTDPRRFRLRAPGLPGTLRRARPRR
jgi:hypothetical protein